MDKVWVIVADGTRGRIFEAVEPARVKLREIDNFVNPEGHESAASPAADSWGRGHREGPPYHGRVTTAREEGSVAQADERFAHSIGEMLRNARAQHRYDGLRVFAPPKFLGLLRQSLDNETRELLEAESAKDISWLDLHEIDRYIDGPY